MVPMQEIESRHEHDCTIRACRDVPNLIEHIDAFASDLREARATIAELQREIEGYQQALEQEMCERHRLGFVRSKDCFSPAAGSDARCMRVRRVLAGKEAHDGN